MVAASNNRPLVVQLLLINGADVNLMDYRQRSALSYASETGDLDSVEKMCMHGAMPNDGSLHEASRELHYPVVQYLLQNGHDPDFPSSIHEARSALIETLLKASFSTEDKRPHLYQTVKALLDSGADTNIKHQGKNALYSALHNKQPYEVLDAFLSTDQWKTLDARHNWYTDALGICYSATMYIEKGPWQGKASHRGSLLKLLRMRQSIDRYFVWEGEQPPDVRNPPEDVAEKHRAQRAVVTEHKLRMRLARRSHVQQLEFDQERHAMALAQDRQRLQREAMTKKLKFHDAGASAETHPFTHGGAGT